VYGLAAAALAVILAINAVHVRTLFGDAEFELYASDLRSRVWWDQSRPQVLLIGLSVLVVVAVQLIRRRSRGSAPSGRIGLAGAVLWFVGVLVASRLWWLTGPDVGWFTYAPNAGVVFSPGEPGLDRERIGLLVAGVGLAITTGAIAWSFRRSRGGSDA
jgi:hypothetical protein